MEPEERIAALETELAESKTQLADLTTKLTTQTKTAETAAAEVASWTQKMDAAKTQIVTAYRSSLLAGVPEEATKFAPSLELGEDLAPTPESVEAVGQFRALLNKKVETPTAPVVPKLPKPGGDSLVDEEAYWHSMRTDPTKRADWVKPETQVRHREYLHKKTRNSGR